MNFQLPRSPVVQGFFPSEKNGMPVTCVTPKPYRVFTD